MSGRWPGTHMCACGCINASDHPATPQDFFAVMDSLVFVEATIYHMDEANEQYARQGLLMPHAHAEGCTSSFCETGCASCINAFVR